MTVTFLSPLPRIKPKHVDKMLRMHKKRCECDKESPHCKQVTHDMLLLVKEYNFQQTNYTDHVSRIRTLVLFLDKDKEY
jgi:hypothetical protein